MKEERSQSARKPSSEDSFEAKKAWQEPKLAYVEPKLVKLGELKEMTGQSFFGSFTP